MPKTKPVIVSFMEATYTITSNIEDYEKLTDVRSSYKSYCVSQNITPMSDSIFLTVLLNKFPALTLTTKVINEEEVAVLTNLVPIS